MPDNHPLRRCLPAMPLPRPLLPAAAGAALVLLWAPFALAQGASLTARCEDRVPKVPVAITTAPIAYTLDTSLPHKEIAQLAGKTKAGTYVLGLTRARFNTRISYVATLMHERSSQRECLLPVLSVSLAYPSVTVFIGREFPEGSCAYREILMHELQHVQAFQQHMGTLEATVRQALTERFSSPLYAEMGRTQAALGEEINTVWKPFILAEQRKVESLQKQVDAPEEVRRVLQACGTEFRKTILDARNEAAAAANNPGE